MPRTLPQRIIGGLGAGFDAMRETPLVKSVDPQAAYQDVHAVAEPVMGEQGLGAQEMQKDTHTRSAELAATIGDMVKAGRLDVKKAAKLLDQLPRPASMGNESVLAAFLHGASAGATAAGIAGAASEAFDMMKPKPQAPPVDPAAKYRDFINTPGDESLREGWPAADDAIPQDITPEGARADARTFDRDFPGPGAMGRKQDVETVSGGWTSEKHRLNAMKPRGAQEIVPDDGYFYHGTNPTNPKTMEGIRRNGLRPTGGQVHFAPDAAQAREFGFRRYGSQPTLLRVRRELVDAKEFLTNTFVGRKTVGPENLEVFVNGRWKSLVSK